LPVGRGSRLGDDGVKTVPVLIAQVRNGEVLVAESGSELPKARVVHRKEMEVSLLVVVLNRRHVQDAIDPVRQPENPSRVGMGTLAPDGRCRSKDRSESAFARHVAAELTKI
jgi:hypothetical protein